MKVQKLTVLTLLLLVVGLTATALALHWVNGPLRARISGLPRHSEIGPMLQAANENLQTIVLKAKGNDGEGTRAIHAELIRVRGQVADLEQRAERRQVQLLARAAKEAEALATNRDPQKGLVRPEYFQNAGQATPIAAFQTLVWAAVAAKDDGTALAKIVVFSETAQTKAEALIAGLPAEARASWTPDKLAALFFGSVLVDVSGVEISSETNADPQHATVSFRVPGVDETKTKADFQLGPAGWQVIVTPEQIDALKRRMARF